MKRLAATLLAALVLVGCNGATTPPTSTPSACPGPADVYGATMEPLVERWDAAVQAADRTASAPAVEVLRAIRREAGDVATGPCLSAAHGHMLGSMDATVAGFDAALDGRPQTEIEAAFVRAEQELGLFETALTQAMGD
jgi:hypothetical protein